MFPLWEVAIAPVLAAANAKRVVEIGALRGENTTQLLEFLGPDGELHVIDPLPAFDPAEHERRFPGRYTFHRDISHKVLPTLPPMDAALVDGDHNWFTVYHELKMLAEVARRAGRPMPVTIMHDVLWPYGRRDLYYAPEQIPDEFRQPYAQAGIRPGRAKLLANGGLNPTMHNAVEEGGPRNGVMTALDDFEREYDRKLRRITLPIYFGLAIVAEQQLVDDDPDLAAALDRLEGLEAAQDLLRVAEDLRLRAMLFQHNVAYRLESRLEHVTRRYLDVVRAALLDEHYLENEVRLAYLTQLAAKGRKPDPMRLRDPARHDQDNLRQLLQDRRAGVVRRPEDQKGPSFLPLTTMGRTRLERLQGCLDTVRSEGVPGDLAEIGTGRGGGAIFMRAYLDIHGLTDRSVWVADRFRASDEPDLQPNVPPSGIDGLRADLNLVRDAFDRFGLLDEQVRFLQGPYGDTLAEAPVERLALLRVGPGLGTELTTVLERWYDKVVVGGFVIVDDHADSASRSALEQFREQHRVTAPLEQLDWSAVAWRKEASPTHVGAGRPEGTPTATRRRAPVPPPTPTDALDLSVVVVFYNMRREAQRTLRSLSRAYQEGIEDVGYEVVVVENGSAEDEKAGRDFVESFGPEFRYIDMGLDAAPSPVRALNRGLREARGRNLAFMIDGAHVLTPGVLRFGLDGLRTYAPAIVATQQWYVGPGQQGEAMDGGYDQDREDRLFETIEWPTAGYRLFEIGHFVGDRDWFDGVWESNCLFVPRPLLEQVGGYDDSFDMAGGGFANLEFYERLGATPDVTVVSILGEGSFHQVHGGTTTNQPDPAERRDRVFGYGTHYAEQRGRRFKGPGKPIHYVGRIGSSAARRSKARRMVAPTFTALNAPAGPDGVPQEPTPVPDDLRWAFVDAVWRSLAWQNAEWAGHRLTTAPTDLIAYQELISEVRPDWIVEVGTGGGGRTLFLAGVCDLVGHGEVVSIDEAHPETSPRHARIRYVQGRLQNETVASEVRDLVGDGRALVILGGCVDRQKTNKQFELYSPLVPVGSYVVVTDTIVNGHPVWPAFSAGPAESVKQILATHGNFVQDSSRERWSLTFNPGGFLKRVR